MVDEVMLRAQLILPGAATRLAARVADPADVAAALLPLLDSTPAAEVWAALHSEGGKPGAKGARPATAKPAAGGWPKRSIWKRLHDLTLAGKQMLRLCSVSSLCFRMAAVQFQAVQSHLLDSNKPFAGAAKPAAKGTAVPEPPASFKQHPRYVEMAALIMEAAARQGQAALVLQWAERVQQTIKEASSVPRPAFDRWELGIVLSTVSALYSAQ